MQVFGTGCNQVLFENHVLSILEKARFDHVKAVPFVEVFLGDVFRKDAQQAKPGEIYLPDADEYRQKYGSKAGQILAEAFLALLAKIIREHYLPDKSHKWILMEKQLRVTLDFRSYCLTGEALPLCPAWNAAEELFKAAVSGRSSLELIRVKEAAIERTDLDIDYHSWRQWFYGLWGQNYEWGRFAINRKIAEANGILYKQTLPPYWEGETLVIGPRQLLEGHGFKVVLHPDQTVEYWR